MRELREAVGLALIVFLALTFALQHAVVEGESMLPNFERGERLLVNKLAFRWRAPARGDVVVFHAPGGLNKEFIKRVVGLPGERVEIRDGLVYVNGQLLDEPWQPIRDHTAFPPYVVPPGQVFVLGDNRPNSNDSRTWGGGLPIQRIVGRAWLCIWPPERFGLVARPRRSTGHPTETGSSNPGTSQGGSIAPP